MSGLPSCWPRALAAASASLVRCAIRLRSFSATAAWMCSMKGSTSGPKFGDDERHALHHQAADEMNVAA